MSQTVAERRGSLAGLLVAATVGIAILCGLGAWQLERLAWKTGLIASIEARAYGEPGAVPPESAWAAWQAGPDEYRRVRLTGRLLNDQEIPVHGLAELRQGEGLLGYYVFTPLLRDDGSTVMVNRGFVPEALRTAARREAGQPDGPVTVTGLMRSPEERGWFVPANNAARNEWFVRNLDDMARARHLGRVAPFYVDADATPNPGGWPRGGQTRLSLPNDHLQYAFTWFGLALTLAGVAGAFAWKRFTSARSGETGFRPEDVQPEVGSASR